MKEKNLKTTILGILTILGAICSAGIKLFNGEMPSYDEIAVLIALFTTGGGLLKAKDAE
jgi:hypothetical protein